MGKQYIVFGIVEIRDEKLIGGITVGTEKTTFNRIELSSDLGLPFTGIDLMIDKQGDIYCLEVNPSAGFSYYEKYTGQNISNAVTDY